MLFTLHLTLQDVEVILKAVSSSEQAVHSLDLRYNRITDGGAETIANCVKVTIR